MIGQDLNRFLATELFGLKVSYIKGHPCAWDHLTKEPIFWYPEDWVVCNEDGSTIMVRQLHGPPDHQRMPRYTEHADLAMEAMYKTIRLLEDKLETTVYSRIEVFSDKSCSVCYMRSDIDGNIEGVQSGLDLPETICRATARVLGWKGVE